MTDAEEGGKHDCPSKLSMFLKTVDQNLQQ
jgi:hypothetical protein